MNVRYVLEGSVQRSGNRLRVNVQLIDAETGNHLWAERFDKPVADLFDMQDEIVSRLANTLDAQLIAAEALRSERVVNPDALDLIFQGLACVYRGSTYAHMLQARGFFDRALALDPTNLHGLVANAMVDVTTAGASLTDDREARFAAAESALTSVLLRSADHALAHLLLGVVYCFTNRAAQGIAECERALTLDRNLADAQGCIGMAKYFMGRGAETEAHIQEALRLSPRDTFAYRWFHIVGVAKLQIGADKEAVVWLRRSNEANRNFPLAYFALASALAQVGALDQAREAARAGLELNPNFTVRRLLSSTNPTSVLGRERLCDGMRMAGVPE